MKEKTAAVEKAPKDRKELHDIFFTVAIITAIVGFIFVWLAQNAVNAKNGCVTLQPFNIKKPIEIEFLTISITSIISGLLGATSIGFGIARNIFKRESKLTSYLCGIVILVLAFMAFMAGVYAE